MVSRALTFLAVLLLVVPGACAVQNASDHAGAGNGSAAEDAGMCTVCQQLRAQQMQQTPTPEPADEKIGENDAIASPGSQEHRLVQAHVRAVIEAQQQAQARELENMSAAEKEVFLNQNAGRFAAATLLALEDGNGGIGGNASAIARALDQSVQATVRAEERIRARSGIVRFFAGGDAEAAEILAAEVGAEGERIRELNRIVGECDCDEETKAMLTGLVRSVEPEMARLQALARNETENKGLLGWLWK